MKEPEETMLMTARMFNMLKVKGLVVGDTTYTAESISRCEFMGYPVQLAPTRYMPTSTSMKLVPTEEAVELKRSIKEGIEKRRKEFYEKLGKQ